MQRAVRIAALGTAVAACQFDRPADVPFPADASLDSAPPECEAAVTSCVGDRYTQCQADGRFVRYSLPNGGPGGEPLELVMDDYPCPLGCHPTEPRCNDLAPTNGLATAFDTADVSPSGLDLVIDDPTGEAALTDGHEAGSTSVQIAFANGTAVTVPAQVVAQPAGPDLRILMVRTFTIRPGSRLKIRAAKPVAIASHFDVFIAGTLDYSGTNNVASTPQPGCDVPMIGAAGAGPGNADAGGASSTGQAGGARQTSNPDLVPLTGGCTSTLGIGGGGIQLVSRTRIAVVAGGTITVAGRRGQALTAGGAFYMGAGGAGGNVSLEAPTVGIASGARIIGRGGGGAAGNSATRMAADGAAGDADPMSPSVSGGVCPDCAARGGSGGTEAATAGGAATGAGQAVAGGGGAVGRAVIRTRAFAPPPGVAMQIIHQYGLISTR